MDTKAPDEVWQIARRVVEEAYGRYGLRLFVGIESSIDVWKVRFIEPKTLRLVELPLSWQWLVYPEFNDIEPQIEMLLRGLATWRDKRVELNKN